VSIETLVWVLGALWAASGVASYVYWWTSEYDLTLIDLIAMGSFSALAGPLSFIIGYSVHGAVKREKSPVVLRRRK
jgi:hypothetical protein